MLVVCDHRSNSSATVTRRKWPVASGAAIGFTLIELITSMAIVAVLAAIAFPMFQSSSTASEANTLLSTIQFARSAAIKQGVNVVICPSTNSTANFTGSNPPVCSTGTSWSTGWIVLTPASGLCSATGGATGDQVLASQPPFSGSDSATFIDIGANNNTAFCFNKYGFSSSAYTGNVKFDAKSHQTSLRRCMIVSGVGHAQVVKSGQYDAQNSVQCP